MGLDGDFSKEKKLWQIYQKMHMQLNERKKTNLQMNSDFQKLMVVFKRKQVCREMGKFLKEFEYLPRLEPPDTRWGRQTL